LPVKDQSLVPPKNGALHSIVGIKTALTVQKLDRVRCYCLNIHCYPRGAQAKKLNAYTDLQFIT
jgi:hypothetical protein